MILSKQLLIGVCLSYLSISEQGTIASCSKSGPAEANDEQSLDMLSKSKLCNAKYTIIQSFITMQIFECDYMGIIISLIFSLLPFA